MNAENVESTSPPLDRSAIKRRRRWLYGFAALALIAVVALTAQQLLSEDETAKSTKNTDIAPPVILERIEMKPVKGQSGRGLGELVRREKNDGLRVIAVKLRPTLDDEVYQLVVAGGKSEPKLLGNARVGQNKTFVGEAKISAGELHKYERIELRRVGSGQPPIDKLVLRGKIPG